MANFLSFLKSYIPLPLKRALVYLYRNFNVALFFYKSNNRFLRLTKAGPFYGASPDVLLTGARGVIKLKGKGCRVDVPESSKNRVINSMSNRVSVVGHDRWEKKVSSSSLMFVESSLAKGAYEEMAKVLENRDAYLLFRSKKDFFDFVALMGYSSEKLTQFGKRLSYIPTIDPNLDELVYGQADKYAKSFLCALEESFRDYEQYEKFSNFIKYVKVGVADRLVGWVRNYYFLTDFLKENGLESIFVFGGKVPENNILASVISSNSEIVSFVVKNGAGEERRKLYRFITRSWAPAGKAVVTKYHLVDHCEPGKPAMLFFGNFKDPVYRGTLKPVLDEVRLRTDSTLLVVLPHPDHIGDTDSGCKCLPPNHSVDDLPGLPEFNDGFDASIDKFLLSGFSESEFEGMYRSYLILNSRRAIHRLIRDCYSLMREADGLAAMQHIDALVSNPGRLWPSQFLTGYFSSIPSFELQSGTLSKSNRFKCPNSKNILAVDGFSKKVYTDYLGVDEERVTVVGAPRIDAKLSEVKRFSKLGSRRAIGFPGDDDKIICIATQPYDIGVMTDMVDTVAKFVSANEGWYLLLSIHPNENDAFENSYKSVLGSLGANRYAISRGNVYHNLNSSDLVVTYFSTSGLEAFCLDKLVLTFRPDKYDDVPFDLCELGVAVSFSDLQELELLALSKERVLVENDDLLRLKDGKSVERIASIIIGDI